jgi:hypothetical protein
MGGVFSRNGGDEKRKQTLVYAELISEKSLPADLPPIKVLINESLATSAVDQIRDSHHIANELSKELVMDMLTDKKSPEKLGTLLKHVFKYESLLQPTRELIYWSLKLPTTYQPIYELTKSSFDYVGVSRILYP